jgi:hypothetical protein
MIKELLCECCKRTCNICRAQELHNDTMRLAVMGINHVTKYDEKLLYALQKLKLAEEKIQNDKKNIT